MDTDNRFTSSLILSQNLMNNVKPEVRAQYYYVLEYLINLFDPSEPARLRLEQYKNVLVKKNGRCKHSKTAAMTKSELSRYFQSWEGKYRQFIFCNFALITMDKEKIRQAAEFIKDFISHSQYETFVWFGKVLQAEAIDPKWMSGTKGLFRQYFLNVEFQKKKEIKIIVTANMSAGKSTLINALVGKNIARTSQEACTGSACMIYSKPFEDECIHLKASKLLLDAREKDLKSYEWGKTVSIASHFRSLDENVRKICLIDTPGVNSAINKSHGNITRKVLLEEQYDTLLYIFNANKLGTDEEMSHLKWVSGHIPHEKTVFVLNKSDEFGKDDNIQESLSRIENDLKVLGYEDPLICPTSAYYAYLLKKKHYGETMSEDENDEYDLYSKKFAKPEYDLSGDPGLVREASDQYEMMSKKCGMYNLEKILYGEQVKMKKPKQKKTTKQKKEFIKSKKVFIKYNPYKLETEITVDGKPPKGNSKLKKKAAPGNRLQEWVDELPYILADEYNDRSFDIVFHGTLPDYEDLDEALSKAYENQILEKVKLERKPAKEIADKEKLIDEVFREIQKGPFDELRSDEIVDAFKLAKSSDFEVCVVATMSAGKSTLINAMLQKRLMPSKQEACTAIITRIKDNDQDSWKAKVYNRDGDLIETQEKLTYKTMGRLNEDENVSEIRVEGNIPFVTAEDVSLVLIDTPGPNNSRDPGHARVQSEFLGKSSKSLVLYIMERTFGSDDDNALLKRVAESMSVGGKQSKDRFIFVVNKMDNRRKDDGGTEQMLDRIRDYLKRHGIENPNLFPAAALPALDIRMLQNEAEELDEDTIDETELKVRKLNRNEDFHFEKFASLPLSIKEEIEEQLKEAVEKDDKYSQALIHTGIVSVEAAIRQYVQKYAKTAKIKNIVDTFMKKFDEVDCIEETKRELAERQEDGEKSEQQLDEIQKKIDEGYEVEEFKTEVEKTLEEIAEEFEEAIEKLEGKYEQKITDKILEYKNEKIATEKAKEVLADLVRFTDGLKTEFEADLADLIDEYLIQKNKGLFMQYQQKVVAFIDERDEDTEFSLDPDEQMEGAADPDEDWFDFEPIKLTEGDIDLYGTFDIDGFIEKNQKESIEYVSNTDKKWYKPWTWFQMESKTYIPGGPFIRRFLRPVRVEIYRWGEEALQYSSERSEEIAAVFQLCSVWVDVELEELKSCAVDYENAEDRIRESEEKLKWLEEIREKIEAILEI